MVCPHYILHTLDGPTLVGEPNPVIVSYLSVNFNPDEHRIEHIILVIPNGTNFFVVTTAPEKFLNKIGVSYLTLPSNGNTLFYPDGTPKENSKIITLPVVLPQSAVNSLVPYGGMTNFKQKL